MRQQRTGSDNWYVEKENTSGQHCVKQPVLVLPGTYLVKYIYMPKFDANLFDLLFTEHKLLWWEKQKLPVQGLSFRLDTVHSPQTSKSLVL